MSKRAGGSNIPLCRRSDKATHTSAPKEDARHRSLRVIVVCSLFLLACLTLPCASLQTANAQDVPEVFLTNYKFDCDTNYQLALVSVNTTLRDPPHTPASALGFVLISRQNAPSKIFNIYSFGTPGAEERKRDDDAGKFALSNYDSTKIEENLANFLAAAGCQGNQIPRQLATAMARVLNASPANLTAREFAQAVAGMGFGGFNNLSTAEELPSLDVTAKETDFGQAIRQYSSNLKSGADGLVYTSLSGNGEDSQRNTKQLKARAEAAEKKAQDEEARATALQAELDGLKNGGSTNYWLWVGVPLALALTGLVLYFYRRKIPFLTGTGGATSSHSGTVSNIAAGELVGMLQKSHNKSGGIPEGRPDLHKEAIQWLQGQVKWFLWHRHPQGSGELERILSSSQHKLMLAERDRFYNYKGDYEGFWEQLDSYQKKYYQYPPVQNAGRPLTPEELPSDKEKLADVDTSATTVRLDESSLKAIEERIATHIKKLPEHMDSRNQQVKELWQLWFGPGEPVADNALDRILRVSRDAQEIIYMLREKFNHNNLSLQDSKGKLKSFFDELSRLRNQYLNERDVRWTKPDDILKGLSAKLGLDEEALREFAGWKKNYDTTQVKMGILRRGSDDVFQTAQRLAYEHNTILPLLKDYRQSGDIGAIGPVEALLSKVGSLSQRLKTIELKVSHGMPEAEGTAEEMVESLVGELRAARRLSGQAEQLQRERDEYREQAEQAAPEAASGKDLAVEISQYLNFNVGKVENEAKPVNVMRERLEIETPLYRQLRLRLSAALLMLDKALKDGNRGEVITALRLEQIREKLEAFTRSLEDLNEDVLWERGVSAGFTESWLHDLFRAHLLLQGYFSNVVELYTTREAVAEAWAVLKSAMHHRGVEVVPVSLFEYPSQGIEEERNALPALLKLPEVQKRVTEKYRSEQKGGFIVDALTFAVKINDIEKGTRRVAIMNPSDWV